MSIKKELNTLKNILSNTDRITEIQKRIAELDEIITRARDEQQELIKEYISITKQGISRGAHLTYHRLKSCKDVPTRIITERREEKQKDMQMSIRP